MLKMPIALILTLVPSLALSEAVAPKTYGDTLLRQMLLRHRSAEAIDLTAIGSKNRAIHVQVVRNPSARTVRAIVFPLANALGEPIGSVSIKLRKASSTDLQLILSDLSRHIYAADTLVEPDPFVDGAVSSRLCQALVEDAVDRHPTLVTLALHVAFPGMRNRIIASNFGRIGKLADKDDAHVIDDGAVLRERTNGGRRLAVELPLHDRRGRTIGALSTSFLIGTDENVETADAEAIAMREELARAIPSLAALAR